MKCNGRISGAGAGGGERSGRGGSDRGPSGEKYLAIQFWETFDPAVFRYSHTPWLRLLDVAAYQDDGTCLALARVTLGEGAEAGTVTALSHEGRRGSSLPTETLRLRRAVSTGGPTAMASPAAVGEAPTAEIRARAEGGLEIRTAFGDPAAPIWQTNVTIDGASGNIGLAPTNGSVGIGTTEPAPGFKLDIHGSLSVEEALVQGSLNTGTITMGASTLSAGTAGALRIKSPSGSVDVGPQNSGYVHFITDMPKYYFNREIQVLSGLIRQPR